MQYMLIMTESEADFAERDDPETAGSYWAGWAAY